MIALDIWQKFVRFAARNQWLRLFEKNFEVSITQLAKKENTPTCNGLHCHILVKG